MVNRNMKRCSASLTTWEMQIKNTLKYYLTPVKMIIIKKTEITCFAKDVEPRKSVCTVDGNLNWCGHCRKQYGGFSKNYKIELPYDPASHTWVRI